MAWTAWHGTARHVGSPPDAGAEHIRCGGGRWSGKSASIARRRVPISTPVGLGVGAVTPTKKRDLAPSGRGTRAQPRGLITTLRLACDGRGRPLWVVITAGQRHESALLAPLLDEIRVPGPGGGGRGRPRTRPDRLIADNGYSYARCRQLLRRLRIPHTIPQRSDQRAQRTALGLDNESASGLLLPS